MNGGSKQPHFSIKSLISDSTGFCFDKSQE